MCEENDFETIFGYPSKIVIPLSLKNDIINSTHASKQSVHYKLQSTYYRVSSKYHWKSMKNDISLFIKQCVFCNISQDRLNPKDGIYSNLECGVLYCIVVYLSNAFKS